MYRALGPTDPNAQPDDLKKPFRVPMKRRNPLRQTRSARRAVTFTVAECDGDVAPKRHFDPSADLSRPFKARIKAIPADTEFKGPVLGMKQLPDRVTRPLHDPTDEFAVVLYDPTLEVEDQTPSMQEIEPSASQKLVSEREHAKHRRWQGSSLDEVLGLDVRARERANKASESTKVAVVIDPRLAKILRPHQIDGVKFLYRCTMGFVDPQAHGCIMADEMGLGKTLQCIALLWTLLRQSPQGRKGTIQKALIICPSSLVRNWANELDKWLGPGTIVPLAIDGKSVKSSELSAQLQQWAATEGRAVTRPVLIISYETLRRNVADLANTEIGLLLADEGHRLKNGDSQTFTALDALNAKRRVILSGTPIQNDLSEYFSLLSFANPGLLGTRAEFRKTYELAILRGRDAFASDSEVAAGEAKLQELLGIVNRFIIRRTNDILSKYLPVKYEHVVFCGLSEFQRNLYRHFLQSKSVGQLLKGNGQPLYAINILKKICTHPELVDLEQDIAGFDTIAPADFCAPPTGGRRRRPEREVRSWYSGKFMVLERMLARIRAETNDKIVVISNYTQTLDMIDMLCRERRYGTVRLDGTMAISKRQKLVDRFNNPKNPEFIFLLSSKAGGCGINLIGANRLILLDPDWNPASDQQALARIWRDGQMKDCFVYRFIATGTIEEKIFQRQSMKQSLSAAVVDENVAAERYFSFENLRLLFHYNEDTNCETHDTFRCRRCNAEKQLIKAPALLYGDATTWNHYPRKQLGAVADHLLQQESTEEVVDFVFQYISH